MKSNISGQAAEHKGHATAKVDWLANTFFTNLTADPLTVVWIVAYPLRLAAVHAPPVIELLLISARGWSVAGSR